MCSDAPDTSGLNAQAVKSADLADKAFQWFTDEYNRTAPDREKATQQADAVTQAQLKAMDTQTAQAQDYADYNKQTFRPLEQRIVSDAQNYDTPERRQAESDAAVADVGSAMGQQREASAMDMARAGIAPDSMRSQALTASGDINAARLASGAAYKARHDVEATGAARMADAANLGRNLPSAQATAIQTSTNAGNSAVNASDAALNAAQSGAGMMQAGFGDALQGTAAAGKIFGNIADINQTANAQNNQSMMGIGKMAGAALPAVMSNLPAIMSFFSDENVKKDTGRPADTKQALAEVVATPVDDGWSYDPAKGGPDDGGIKHTGPMAQAVRATMGDQVAPGGKVIDVVNMNGKLMAGMQELAKRVKKIEGARK